MCHLVDFAVLVNDRVKIEERKMFDKFLDLGRKLKKLWIIRVTVIPIVVGALGTVIKEIRGRIKTIKTTAF